MTQSNLNELISALLLIILPFLSASIRSYFNKKANSIETSVKNEDAKHYIGILNDTVNSVVTSLDETTVSKLKTSGKFDETTAKSILEDARIQILNIIGENATYLLSEIYSDLNQLIIHKIECAVKANKTNVVDNTPVHNITVNNNVPTITPTVETAVTNETTVEFTPVITPAVPLVADIPTIETPVENTETVASTDNTITPV